MKLRKMLYGLTFLLSAFALSSCVNDESACLPEGSTKVVFTLELPDNAQTRALWEETYLKDTGLDYDNFIDLNGIQVLVFENTQAGTYVGTIDDFMYSKTGKNVYTYSGTAPSDLSARGTYKFVVLANCSKVTLTENSTIADLNNLAYSLASMEYIPMWGVHTATLNLVPGQQCNIGNISLLRAISKVSVKLSPDMIAQGFTLKSVTVDKYNSEGYVLPADAATVAETTKLNQETCINAKASEATNWVFSGTSIMAEDSVRIYMPEYANKTSKDATMSVVVVSPDGEEMEFLGTQGEGIAFMNYANGVATEGSEYDIVRNHHYIFTITSAEVGHKLTLRVVTIPWEDAQKIEIDYTQTIGWKDSGEPQWSVTPVTEGEFEVINVEPGDTPTLTFTLDSPQGWQWLAVLEPLTDNANSFIQFQDGSSSATGSVGQLATLNFKITTDPASVNHRARLRLYVQTPGSPSREVQVKYIISRSY